MLGHSATCRGRVGEWHGQGNRFTLRNVQQFEQDNTPNDPTGAIETTSAADSAGAADTTNRTDPTVEANETMMAATNVTAVPLEGENSTTTSLKTQILRFIATGCVSAVVDFGLLLLLSYLGLNTTVSKGISFICGTALAYALNRRWTFQAEHSTKRLIAVCILYAVTFGLNVGIFHVVYKATLSLGHLWAKTIGFVVGQAVATIVNFIVQRTVIFRVR